MDAMGFQDETFYNAWHVQDLSPCPSASLPPASKEPAGVWRMGMGRVGRGEGIRASNPEACVVDAPPGADMSPPMRGVAAGAEKIPLMMRSSRLFLHKARQGASVMEQFNP
jgi:hypothetical protein